MNFYALYSRSSRTYNTPFLAHDDEEAKRIIEKTVTMQNDMALIYSLDDLEIHLVGEFVSNREDPICGACEGVVIVEDLVHDLCYPPMIKDMLTRLYSRKEDSNGK